MVTMLCPVRCYTCNNLLANKCREYQRRIKEKEIKKVLDDLNLTRYCCRTIMMTFVDML